MSVFSNHNSLGKRERDDDASILADASASADSPTATSSSGIGGAASSNFRNVSACNRCRHRKNRCDQRLPRCTNCEKSNSKCVGFDPVSKREIPRSYVYYLESRVDYLETVLQQHNIKYAPPEENFSVSDNIKPGFNVPFPPQDEAISPSITSHPSRKSTGNLDPALQQRDSQEEKLDKLVSNIGMVSVQGASDSRYLGSTSGISFARVVFAAVKSSVGNGGSERSTPRPHKAASAATAETASGGSSMRDSFFGLHTKPNIRPAPFPDKDVALGLVQLYFEHANPQIPILHRTEFMAMFERVYNTEQKKRSARELYMLNIVFAIGSGIINESSTVEDDPEERSDSADPPNKKRQRTTAGKQQPENYHSSAIVHLESFFGSSPATEGVGGGLEELQAVLLLAGLALLRPVAPGLWYIIGVAVRLSIDLGLHFEEIDPELDAYVAPDSANPSVIGRKQWTRDLRRRLWWCVYTFDRLVSTCVGRPFGITDQVVTTEFPCLLDDRNITTAGFLKSVVEDEVPTYKLVSHHYFRLRLLQSEVLQVLQHRQAQQARALGANRNNAYMFTNLSSPFLENYRSFSEWRVDVDRRLWEWKESAPNQQKTGVAFNTLFLELNYWQAVIMLYRQSLAAPPALASELNESTGEDVQSPGASSLELKEDEETVFLKVAQAGQTVLKIYRQLHRLKLVNYTFLATHHLFMSGISFLYAIWHSTAVRSQLTLDDVDFTILAATSVLTDLIEKCPPAEACRDAFVRMSKATISMCMSTTGFGSSSSLGTQPINYPGGYFARIASLKSPPGSHRSNSLSPPQPQDIPTPKAQPIHIKASQKRPTPKFDMNLKDLFSDEEIDSRPYVSRPKVQQQTSGMLQQQQQHQPAWGGSPVSSIETGPRSGVQGSSFSSTAYSTSPQHQHQQAIFSPSSQHSQISNQQPYQPFANTISQFQPDFTFDNMDWLDTFPVADPSNPNNPVYGGANDLFDLGFGTGGTGGNAAGMDGSTGLEGNNPGGVDLFDGFFFGNNGG